MIKNKRFSGFFRIFVSLFFIGLLFWLIRGNIPELAATITSAKKNIYLLCICIQLVCLLIAAYRFTLVAAAQETYITVKESIYLTFIGLFFNNFLPTALGGDLIRGYYAAKKTGRTIQSYSSILADRILGFIPLVLMAGAAIIIYFPRINNIKILIAVCGLLILLAVIIFSIFHPGGISTTSFICRLTRSSSIQEKVERFHSSLASYKNKKEVLVNALLLSFLNHIMLIFSIYLLINAIHTQISIVHLFWSVPLVFTLSMLPSLNGLGIREGAFVYFLKSAIGTENSLALAILWLSLFYITSIIGGFVYLVFGNRFGINIKNLQNEQSNEEVVNA